MNQRINDPALKQLFRDARSHNAWTDRPVGAPMLHDIWNLMKMPPTSANCSPARIVFVTTPAARQKLRPALIDDNVEKVMTAPVTAIVGMDMAFHDTLPRLFPHTDARSWFAGNDALIAETAFRNSTLQGAYFMMAARACGLDCGPLSGFDNDAVDQAFFAGTAVKSNFLCAIGYGSGEKMFGRSPRLDFEEACQIA